MVNLLLRIKPCRKEEGASVVLESASLEGNDKEKEEGAMGSSMVRKEGLVGMQVSPGVRER